MIKKMFPHTSTVRTLAITLACISPSMGDIVEDKAENKAATQAEASTAEATAAEAAADAAAATAQGNGQTPARIANRIAATVNGRPITSSELRARLAPFLRELMILHPRQGTEFSKALLEAKNKVMDELIERELVISEFESQGFLMPEQQIDEEINNRVLNQFGGNRDELLKYLRATGQSFATYRESMRNEMIVGAMRSSRYEYHIPPTPDEITEEYNKTKRDYRDVSKDKVRFSKIFIPMKNLDEDVNVSLQGNYEEAVRIRKMIDSGEISFSEAAKNYSADMKASEGGKWPQITRGELAPDFAGIVFNAKEGELIGPLFDPSGFTIVKVESIKDAAAPSLADPEVREKVDAAARRRKSETNYRIWVERLKKDAIIRKHV